MTVQTQFWNWQDAPLSPDPQRCAPIGQTWMTYLLGRWGGMNLGCYAARSVSTGSSPSSHWSGAAIDWRYQDPGMGRPAMLEQVIPWLLDNSLELGVQAVHDYAGKRIWRPPGCSGRPSSPSPQCGWKPATSSDMNPANTWLHIECLNTRWSDTRTVDQMLPPPPPPEDDMRQALIIQAGNGSATVGAWAVAPVGLQSKVFLTAADVEALRALDYDEVVLDGATFDRIPGAIPWDEVT